MEEMRQKKLAKERKQKEKEERFRQEVQEKHKEVIWLSKALVHNWG